MKKLIRFFSEADMFFSKHINDASVDYKSIRKNPEQLIKLVAAISAFDFKNAVKNREMAFWINAYNILVIQSVVNNYPLKSRLDVKGFFDTRQHLTGGAKLTLNEIENKKLREKFGDARIHFVLVCAAQSCPPMINRAYLRPNWMNSSMPEQRQILMTLTLFKLIQWLRKLRFLKSSSGMSRIL